MYTIGKSVRQTSGFSPLNIPGCQLWLDAADSSTVTLSGGTVSSVVDKSANRFTLTGGSSFTYNVTRFQGIYPSFFNNSAASDAKVGSNASFNLSQPMTIFVTGVMTAGVEDNDMIFDGNINRVSIYNRTANFFANPNQISPGVIYLTSPYIVCGFANTTSSSILVNSTTVGSGTIGSSALTSIVFGNRQNGNGSPYKGHLCEFLIYQGLLTTAQRQQIEGYLARKWGLQANLPASHPFKSLPPFLRQFSPLDIPNCALWLDAADSTTVTLSGSNVSQWDDKSGNGRNAVAQVAASYNSTSKSLNFTGSNFYSFNNFSFAVASYFSLFLVERLQSSNNFPTILGTDTASANQGPHFRYNGTGNQTTNASGFRFGFFNNDLNANNIPAFTTADAQPIRIWSLVFTASFRGIYLNGTLMSSDTNNTQLSSWNTPLIGKAFTSLSPPTDYFYNGFLFEILGYGGQIQTAQRQQIEAYLANKWGLRGNLPSSHPFKLYNALSVPFNPVQISGCSLWLDAADSTTVTLSGSNVSQWNDKSGFGRNATQATNSNRPIYSNNAVLFNGTTSFLRVANPAIRPANMFVVVQSLNLTNTGNLHILRKGRSSDLEFFLRFQSINNIASGYIKTDGVGSGIGGNTDNPTSRVVVGSTWNGTTHTVYKDGEVIATALFSGTQRTSTTELRIGTGLATAGDNNSAPDGSWDGNIYEIILFNRTPTIPERQQIEGYLAWKWGLRTSLPTSHPYYKFNPS